MFDELVKRLRHSAQLSYKGLVIAPSVCFEAADAIEEMNRREMPMEITEIHVDEYYCPACGQRLFQEPPKEE